MARSNVNAVIFPAFPSWSTHGSLMLGGAIILVALVLLATGSARGTRGVRSLGILLLVVGAGILRTSTFVVIGAGRVGVRHAFGQVDPRPLLLGIRFVTPWSSVEEFSSREE